MTKRPLSPLTIEDVVRAPRPGLGIPTRWRFNADGSGLMYLHSDTSNMVQSLWERDLGAARAKRVAGPSPGTSDERTMSREEALRRERLRMRELGVTDYLVARNADPPVLVVPSPEGLRVRHGTSDLVLLEGTAGSLVPSISPDGNWVAFVRGGELQLVATSGGSVETLTEGAEPGLTNGLAEFIAQEELGRTEGFWWSPDSKSIAFEEADSRHIGRFSIVHDEGPQQSVEVHEYPFAGDSNTKVRIAVIELASRTQSWIEMDPTADGYVGHVCWRPGGALVVSWLNRKQTTLEMRVFEAPDWQATTLLTERTEPWFNLVPDIRFLKDGSFVRTSEQSGFRHICLYTADGELDRALTAGEWVVTGLLALDEASRRVFFQSTQQSVLERHIYSVSLDGGEPQRLTVEPGWHSAVFDRACSRFVNTYSSREHSPKIVIRKAGDGSIEEVAFEQPDVNAEALGLRPPKTVELAASDGTTLYGSLYEPPDEELGRKYPVIVSVYGGPHAQRVANDWLSTVDLRAQYLAERGFVVFKLDNRGSANRGLAFEGHLSMAMGTVEIEDQVAGVNFLSVLPHVDTSRVGIYGWSYGGYLTCLALMKAPEVFSVGVAGAPVADWDGYDTGYTERYMGTPEGNPDGYREASALSHADGLEGRLMLVHGLVDENVHFRHTVRLVAALTEAQKEYDLVLFPAERHVPRGTKGLSYMERRLVGHFERHLK